MSIKKASPARGTPIKQLRTKYTVLQLADQILAQFRGRDDVVAVGSSKGLAPEWLTKPLTAQRFAEEHLGGQRCMARYLMREDNRVEITCLDFDNKSDKADPQLKAKVEAVVQCLREHGIYPLVERSQSGRGAHIWLFLEKPRSAWFIRVIWRGILQHLDLPLGTEIFPRQDERNLITGKGLGNPIRFPLWGKSHFVDACAGGIVVDPMAALMSIVPVKLVELKRLARDLDIELKKPAKTATVAGGPLLPGSLSPRVVQLLAVRNGNLSLRWNGMTDGLNDKSNSAIVASIAYELVRRFVPTNEIEAAVKKWCNDNAYRKGSRQDWIDIVVRRAYEFAWRNDDLRRQEYARSSSNSLPPALKREFQRRVMERTSHKLKGQ